MIATLSIATHNAKRSNFTIKKKYHEKIFYMCVTFTFTFETTKWTTRYEFFNAIKIILCERIKKIKYTRLG